MANDQFGFQVENMKSRWMEILIFCGLTISQVNTIS